MSFTDAMYESIREFYFRGVSYTSHVDLQPDLPSTTNSDDPQEVHIAEDQNVVDESGDIEKDGEDDSYAPDNKDDSNTMATTTDETDRVHCFPDKPSSAFVVTNESPPIWFKPMEVFEVAFADLSLSRQHTAAAGLVDEEGRGVALRFPRFKRRRPDKKPEQATTSIEIAQLFAKQSKIVQKQQQRQHR